MKYSKLFAKTMKNPPKDADTVNHRLLTQAGFVDQLMAGVYSYLPLGLRVLKKIEEIVREEMDAIGGQEILMPVLHPKSIWETTKGWDNIDVLFKIKSRTGKDYALGQSEEEVITPLVMKNVHSYQDLPKAVYQIHWKFRDELRAKSGIMRGREFYMKDLYSFHASQEDFERFYETAKKAYLKIYERLGLVAKVTEASGGNFTEKISYEFMILTDAGEDDILYCGSCEFCVNVEIAKVKEGDECPKCKKSKLKKARASEAGNVFDLGQKYTKDFDTTFIAQDGSQKFPIMGCYGFGVSRVMGVLVEKFHDDKGIIWPSSVAPFDVHLIGITKQELRIKEEADRVYKRLLEAGVEVLYDDREDVSAGAKFADADLIGIPVRLVVSSKSGDKIEWKKRASSETELLTPDEVLQRINK
jgi:prolyl-tRNA synthetase